ncbi:hypothetical protein Pmani_033426, partial [Petrolisthes manimaculis]
METGRVIENEGVKSMMIQGVEHG